MSRRAVRFSLASPGRSADDDTDFGDVDTGTGDEIDLEDDAPGLRLDGHTTGRDHDRASDTDEQGRSVNEAPRVLCVQVKSGLIGCAFYELTTGKLSLLEDAPQDGRRVHTHQARPAEPEDDEEMADDLQAGEQKNEEADLEKAKETLMILLDQFAPVNLVLTNSDTFSQFHAAVRKELVHQDAVLSIRPSTEFSTASGMQRILSLQLVETGPDALGGEDGSEWQRSAASQPSSSRTTTSFGNKLQSSCLADLHSMSLSVGAAGSLLSHLTRIQLSFDQSGTANNDEVGPDAAEPLKITLIETIVLNSCLGISAESRIALDFFEEESHAALHSASRKHEGLSLFGILDTTRTPLSHALLRRWLLLPSTDIEEISSRQAAIAALTSPTNLATVRSMMRELKGVKNIPTSMTQALNGTAKLADWKAIQSVSLVKLLQWDCAADAECGRAVTIKTLCSKRVLNFCSGCIADTLDFEQSAAESRLCIKSGYDEELDQWKQLYAGLPDLLNKIADDIRPDVDPAFKEISVCYFPQLGYLLAIPIADDWHAQLPTVPGWDFQFASENAMYLKGEKMRDLDAHLGDIHTLIVEREIEHLCALQEAICQHTAALLRTADALAELDCLVALADAAAKFGWVRPEMTEENVLEIYQGRHALQELTVDSFVPNDAYLQGGKAAADEMMHEDQDQHVNGGQSLLAITGANGSGKSIYLKQVALIVLLAHIGSFVPAQGARIGICDQILTSIQARHSVSRLQSSFLLDVSQVGFASRQCTPRSLVLFDEIGKGTDATGERMQCARR
ncbi:hypothetical protein V8E36_006772 [Tilletia maclaganii]